MKRIYILWLTILMLLAMVSLGPQLCSQTKQERVMGSQQQITPAAERTNLYFHMLRGQRIAVTANHTSMVGNLHLVDTLLKAGFRVMKVFSPEHGFRGNAPDGQTIDHQIDPSTGIPIVSLYGKKKKPEPVDLEDVDLILFDLQDVGVRFYTYISTMTYVMEAAADAGKPVVILDRPNPNRHYVDGPLLEQEHKSFVGLHPVPIVYGMTIGEYAMMVNGESWLESAERCKLTVIPIAGYDGESMYQLPIPPSPNLPNMTAVYLYPSLALFEGSSVSVGRGTDFPFQVFGHPKLEGGSFRFTPRRIPHASKNPPHLGVECLGYDLREMGLQASKYRDINLDWLIETYQHLGHEPGFFSSYFEKLAGTGDLRQMIMQGQSRVDIRRSWKDDLKTFLKIREKYLIYPASKP